MELWPLAVGVVVLVVIAFWLVSRTPEGADTQVVVEEVSMNADPNPTHATGPHAAHTEPDVAATEIVAEENAAAARDAALAAAAATPEHSYADTLRAYAPAGYSE